MELHSKKLALSAAIVTAALWLLCSVVVAILPAPMMRLSEAMLHIEFHSMNWHLDISGVLIGGVAWAALAAAFVWSIAVLYNYLNKQ